MASESMLALMGFAFVMSISPGPSNFLLLTSGANFGYWRSVPLMLGISAGFLLMVVLVGVGLGEILQQYPALYVLLRVVCGAYVLWLALQIARSRSLGTNTERVATPIGFVQAALFQWLNPKAWAVALILNVSYSTADNDLVNMALLIVLFAAINLPTISIWALSGAALRNWLSFGKRIIFFNVLMALLLVGSMIPMLLNS